MAIFKPARTCACSASKVEAMSPDQMIEPKRWLPAQPDLDNVTTSFSPARRSDS